MQLRTLVAAIVLLGIAAASDQAIATGKITLTTDTPWVIADGQAEAVRRAIEDVKNDWYKVTGHVPVILAKPPEGWDGPIVYLGQNGPWLGDLVKRPWPGPESFILCVRKDMAGRPALVATGADLRGTIYAAYAFSEKVLKVDPWYFWVDKEPARQQAIDVPEDLHDALGPPTFRFRGWFINDEDLLSQFAPDPIQENVFSLEMWDRVCETLLRLRGNMLVPGTFTFPDERCQELASRRGLVLNMHHILVVGLNTYRWPKNVPFSYSQHPEIMERYWQTCIDAFQGREVVWTVGYRGKHDRPFWSDEPEVRTAQQRGDLISRAVAKQVEMIRRKDPQSAIIMNLWAEGAELYQAGQLKVPGDVTIVWPDDGAGMIRDGGMVKPKQGIYYHTAMLSGMSNQLTEMVNPGLICSELGRFAKAGAHEFFLVNTSDIRPVVLSTDCAMRVAWDVSSSQGKDESANSEAVLLDWSRRQFGFEAAPAVAKIYAGYFNIPYQRRAQRNGDNMLQTRLRTLDHAAWSVFCGKTLSNKVIQSIGPQRAFAEENRAYAAELYGRAREVERSIPAPRHDFYTAHVLTQIRIHLHSLEMLEHYCRSLQRQISGDKPRAIAELKLAQAAVDAVFDALHAAEFGKWARFYQGERFDNVDWTRDLLRVRMAQLTGGRLPPMRIRPGYEDIYGYQERFGNNFPLLYGTPGRFTAPAK
jgi:hypothetical protein